MSENRKCISVIMPARNEEGNLPRAYEELTAAFEQLPDHDYEVIVVDNASKDRTPELARELCGRDPRWRYVRFSRDFGADMSITMGMRLARGDAVINVFSDLQDPPALIPEFVRKWEEGYDVVYGVIEEREDRHALRGVAARLAYRIIRFCSDTDIPTDAGDFRIVSRKVKEALDQLPEHDRYVRGLVHWVGFKRASLTYSRRPRQWGDSKAPFWWCFSFALNAVTSFSVKPLRMFTIFGLCVLGLSIALSLWAIIGHFITHPPHGISSVLVLLTWNLAVMSLGIGILGEYLGHVYTEVKNRPKCLIDEVENIDPEYVAEAIRDR